MIIVSYLNVKYSVRSGGHTPNPGYANSDGGVLIDMSKFQSMSLSTDGTVASIGPGLKWVDVYNYFGQRGTTVLGGRIPNVGVGGLLLGGGLSFFANKYGLACDNVKNFEVRKRFNARTTSGEEKSVSRGFFLPFCLCSAKKKRAELRLIHFVGF